MSNTEINNDESMVGRINKLLIISAWYTNFSFFQYGNSDNQVVKILLCSTSVLLTLIFVISFIVTAVKYKGSLMEFRRRRSSDKQFMINCFIFIATWIYRDHFCPEAYQVIVAYAALTIMVINCVLFIFDNSYDNKKIGMG